VLKTLHGYLGKELLRITLLALVAFTLLMTVFAILEPLRKEGLGAGQLAALFLYTLPVMLSFTLPFSALFATSMVYGRFAMDRELLACRASGISFLTILKPAIWLGLGVTLLSLVLINFVSPPMFKAGKDEVLRNVKRIAYNKIQKKGYVQSGGNMLHATDIDEKKNLLHGVVMVRLEDTPAKEKGNPTSGKPKATITIVTAEYATLSTSKVEGQHAITLTPYEVVGPISDVPSGHAQTESLELEQLRQVPLPGGMKEKPAGYSWTRLLATYDDPTLHPAVSKALENYRWKVRVERFANRSQKAIKAGKPILELRDKTIQYEIIAPKCSRKKDSVYFDSIPAKDGIAAKRIKLIWRESDREFHYEADQLKVFFRAKDDMGLAAGVTLQLSGWVKQTHPAVEGVLSSPTLPAISIPHDKALDDRPAGELLKHPETFTTDATLQEEIDTFRTKGLAKIKRKIVAEMHWRICYGSSCLVMVALGAILGIVNRGGQLLAAFATSVIPLVIVLVLAMMGRNMISNPGNSEISGVILMWCGIVVVAGLDLWFYNRLRKV
jgi:lipopolysaccharide export system permease protein